LNTAAKFIDISLSTIVKGIQVYHNYFGRHEGLEGKTPADAYGVIIGENNNDSINTECNTECELKLSNTAQNETGPFIISI